MRTPIVFTFLISSILATGFLTGCSSTDDFDASSQAFADAKTFTRHYDNTPEQSCEASRKALLSQGYIITKANPLSITANKSFQQNPEQHYEIEFHVTCVNEPTNASRVFVNAVQQAYVLKKTNTSASVGVSILGSVSLPIGSSADSMTKIGSATITKPELYNRFFELLNDNLPVKINSNNLISTKVDIPANTEIRKSLTPTDNKLVLSTAEQLLGPKEDKQDTTKAEQSSSAKTDKSPNTAKDELALPKEDQLAVPEENKESTLNDNQ